MTPRAACILTLLALVACDDGDMARQEGRYQAYDRAPTLPGGTAMQHPPPNTVARGDLAKFRRPEISPELLARGGERFAIFCAPCHGNDARGQGPVIGRTLPRSANLRQVLRDREGDDMAHVVAVIENGKGLMAPYASRVPIQDRWAIAAYLAELAEGAE